MTTEDKQHQQDCGGGDDGEVVAILCLHCALSKTIEDWIVDYNEKTGQPVCMNHVAAYIGAALEDFLANIRERVGPEGADTIEQAIRQAQMGRRAENAERAASPVEPNPDTKH